MEHATGTHEVAGPWAFMAPEVEHGGQLDVTPAADVYSLGKLLFHMVSGGTVLPRERLDDPRYATVLWKGGRFHLFDLLLRRMVCEPAGRIQTMAQVEEELGRIDAWDRISVASPSSGAALGLAAEDDGNRRSGRRGIREKPWLHAGLKYPFTVVFGEAVSRRIERYYSAASPSWR